MNCRVVQNKEGRFELWLPGDEIHFATFTDLTTAHLLGDFLNGQTAEEQAAIALFFKRLSCFQPETFNATMDAIALATHPEACKERQLQLAETHRY
ncbi:MAG: hypothetical protein AAGA35_03425 [Patescibacteria group bacterium]